MNNAVIPFPVLLHLVLTQAASGTHPELGEYLNRLGYPSIAEEVNWAHLRASQIAGSAVRFQPHGRAFMVLDQERFCDMVLPL